MSKRYKVIAYGGYDGLKFPDLVVRFTSGYAIPLHVKQDEYVPLQILDPFDIQKSLIVGSLGRYIKGGQIIVEDDEEPKEEKKEEETTKIETLKQEEPKKEELPKPTVEEPKPQPQVEKKSDEKPLTDLSQVKTYEDFCKLTFFLKIEFIKKHADKALLQQILEKTNSPQLQNHVQIRLSLID